VSGSGRGRGLDQDLPERIKEQAVSSGDAAGAGVVGVVVGGLAGAASSMVGAFLALNILFFLIKDAYTNLLVAGPQAW
jgi:hypothetical protein